MCSSDLSEAGLVQAPPGSTVADLFIAAGLASSRNEARRTVSEGGAYVNNERVSDAEEVVAAERALAGGLLVLRKGKRTFAGVELVGA